MVALQNRSEARTPQPLELGREEVLQNRSEVRMPRHDYSALELGREEELQNRSEARTPRHDYSVAGQPVDSIWMVAEEEV